MIPQYSGLGVDLGLSKLTNRLLLLVRPHTETIFQLVSRRLSVRLRDSIQTGPPKTIGGVKIIVRPVRCEWCCDCSRGRRQPCFGKLASRYPPLPCGREKGGVTVDGRTTKGVATDKPKTQICFCEEEARWAGCCWCKSTSTVHVRKVYNLTCSLRVYTGRSTCNYYKLLEEDEKGKLPALTFKNLQPFLFLCRSSNSISSRSASTRASFS